MSTHEESRPAPTLGLTSDEITVRYAALQAKLVPLWKSIASMNRDPQTIVVVPSITLDALNMPPAVLQARGQVQAAVPGERVPGHVVAERTGEDLARRPGSSASGNR